MALLGALLNLIVLCGLFAYRWPLVGEKIRRGLPSSLKITGFLILSTSLFMAFISLFVLKSLCPFCSVTYVLSFISFISLIFLFPKEERFTLGLPELKLIPSFLIATLIFGFFFHKVSLGKYGGKQLQEFLSLIHI